MGMLFLELFLRGATAMVALLCAALLLRDAWKAPAYRWAAAFLFAVASAGVIHTAQGIAPPASVRAVLIPISSSWIVLLWVAARSFFEDEFQFKVTDGLVIALWLGLAAFDYSALAANEPTPQSWTGIARAVLSYGLVGHILYVVVGGAASDLIESRRRSRLGFTISLLSIYLLNKAGEAAFGYSALPIWFTALLFGLITILLSWGLLAIITLDKRALGVSGAEGEKPPRSAEVSAEQKILITRLTQIIEVERAYLEPDLSIRELAARLRIGEHQLRALINQAMGFRNFRAFLNSYRLKHAVSALAMPENKNASILEIAMNSGFGSLASFNRTFKAETGVSPREMKSVKPGQKRTSETAKNSPHFRN
jgi:AraC-like DNA-binding protein